MRSTIALLQNPDSLRGLDNLQDCVERVLARHSKNTQAAPHSLAVSPRKGPVEKEQQANRSAVPVEVG